MNHRIPVFYTPRQSVPASQGYSPSAGKPALMAQALKAMAFPVDIRAPRAVLFSEITRAHDPIYVSNVLGCKEANGFSTRDRRVAQSLPYTSGSMLAAAEAAQPDLPACSLSSGFHHAGWNHGGGFCTFNGLMITAMSLLARGIHGSVAILDCDAHFGNGTAAILTEIEPWFSERILHRTMGQEHRYNSAYIEQLARYLGDLGEFLPDVILYQAGADPHAKDPLGGYISTEEMALRDRMVFDFAAGMGIPLAWNLAGGYQRGGLTGIDPVLDLHLNTFREAIKAYELPCLPV